MQRRTARKWILSHQIISGMDYVTFAHLHPSKIAQAKQPFILPPSAPAGSRWLISRKICITFWEKGRKLFLFIPLALGQTIIPGTIVLTGIPWKNARQQLETNPELHSHVTSPSKGNCCRLPLYRGIVFFFLLIQGDFLKNKILFYCFDKG